MMSSMSRKVLLQFQDWIEHDAFRSFDRATDWRAGIAHLQLPMLVMGGSADRLATADNIEAQFALATAPDRTLHIFGKDHGDKMDYGHGDLVFGLGAPQEVYPIIREWLEKHATLLPSAVVVPPPV
jgi:homoserine acetyltransferase